MKITGMLMLFYCSLMAQHTSPEEEREWVEIRKIKTVYEEAVNNNDLDKLRPYLANGFSGVLLTGDEVKSFDDLKAANQRIRQLVSSYQVKVNYSPGTMSGNTAMAHGDTDDVVVTAGGKRLQFQSHWSADLIKDPAGWKLLRIHASMDPVNNVFVQNTVQYAKLGFGIGGLILGAVVGLVVRGLFGKR
jgi:ketosteroid isomerase-like protein